MKWEWEWEWGGGVWDKTWSTSFSKKHNTLEEVISGTTTSKKHCVLTKKICKNVCGRGPKVLATGM